LKTDRKNLLALTASLAAAILLVFASIQAPSSMQPGIVGSSSSTQITSDIASPPPLTNPSPVVLNTVASAEAIVGAPLIVPNTAVLGGGGYQIVGVQVGMRPQNYTDANGVTYRDWEVEFVITKSSSPAFVNGSTLSSVLYNSAIIVSEAAEPNELNSHESALSFMAPPTSCLTHLNNGSQSCSTISESSSPYHLVQVGNTYVVANPSAPFAYFQIDSARMIIEIETAGGGGVLMSYQQMMNLADTMISSGTTGS